MNEQPMKEFRAGTAVASIWPETPQSMASRFNDSVFESKSATATTNWAFGKPRLTLDRTSFPSSHWSFHVLTNS